MKKKKWIVRAKIYCRFVSIDFHPTGAVRDAATSEGVIRAQTDSHVSLGGRRASLHSLHPGPVHLRAAEDATAEVPSSETAVQDLLAS